MCDGLLCFLIDSCDDVLCKYISQYAIVCKVNNVSFDESLLLCTYKYVIDRLSVVNLV